MAVDDAHHLVIGLQPGLDGLAFLGVILGQEDARALPRAGARSGPEEVGSSSRSGDPRSHAEEFLGQVGDALGVDLEEPGAGLPGHSRVG